MKCVVITGSARELGLELAKEFKKNNYNVVISDILKEETKKVYNILGDYPDVISNFLVDK